MMVEGNIKRRLEHFHGFENQACEGRMLLDKDAFGGVELAGLSKNRLRYAEHSNVVKKRTVNEVAESVLGVANFARKSQGEFGYPVRVPLWLSPGHFKRARPSLDRLLKTHKQLFSTRYHGYSRDVCKAPNAPQSRVMVRVDRDGPLDGVTNMERDRRLLADAERGVPGARVYRWDGPWVSLGVFQQAERDLLPSCGVPSVLRPTGGKAVLHGHDETIGLAIPLVMIDAGSRSLKVAYRAVIQPIVAGMRACGVPAALAENTAFVRGVGKTADCFAHISPNDVVDERTGLKVCGCALKLTQTAVLVQASLPNGLPLVDPQRVFARPSVAHAPAWDASNLADALEEALQMMLVASMTR